MLLSHKSHLTYGCCKTALDYYEPFNLQMVLCYKELSLVSNNASFVINLSYDLKAGGEHGIKQVVG